jgi:hypothetical protein
MGESEANQPPLHPMLIHPTLSCLRLLGTAAITLQTPFYLLTHSSFSLSISLGNQLADFFESLRSL